MSDQRPRPPRRPPGAGPWKSAPSSPSSPPRERTPRPHDAPRAAHHHAPRAPAHDHDDPWQDDAGEHAMHPSRARRDLELRLYGLNAIHAVFARRPQAIRKLYLIESRIPALQPLLKWCVAHRVGYRVVEEGDLDRLAASTHHEGVVADVLREEPQSLSTWLRDLGAGPQCALWLDGVGNPHNFGAILRSAAHFGVSAILLPKHSPLALSGAAARVAEGGAEAVPMVRLGRQDNSLAQLRSAGFALAATVVKGGSDVFEATLPQRLVFVMGSEGEGMDRELAAACDTRVSIPGSGAVESLNVAAATAVLLAAWRARL
ncbi:TrmH family RNA methyltransferase [Lysobacter solisilvae (ex Woo and Kim 2020)]|uniref:rRNA methyltransferase n=1 Tax=Agrilutibacter terrestris TaxID=2865112 RepID=A0A7H0FUT2_9GAMM|nr:TrmH family RNA methyltransferase [Lysobacter terrestris]QNP39798.1 rRNA methyltransferase [Lysobacter terrestris]